MDAIQYGIQYTTEAFFLISDVREMHYTVHYINSSLEKDVDFNEFC